MRAEDFERYIYGGTFNKRTVDQQDKIEEEMRAKLRSYEK